MAGSDPIFWREYRTKLPSDFGGRSRHNVCALQANFPPAPRPQCRKFLSEQTDAAHVRNPGRTQENPCLHKPPEPGILQRRYYLRFEEPLALTMERYAEFLGTDNLDHVVSQALQFIFKRDTQFKSWLEEHPELTPKPTRSKATSKRTAPEGGAL